MIYHYLSSYQLSEPRRARILGEPTRVAKEPTRGSGEPPRGAQESTRGAEGQISLSEVINV